MKILVACEYSGRVRDAFIEKGHDAISADILPTEKKGPHYQGDVRDILYEDWDMIIAFPPCTYITNSGVRWLHTKPERYQKLEKAAAFFRLFLNHKAEKICIENPIPHKYAINLIGKKYNQIVHPWHFGHLYSKATCLWLKGLPKLKHTNNVKKETYQQPKKDRMKTWWMSPGPQRAKLRSLTPEGLAIAMADQWTDITIK